MYVSEISARTFIPSASGKFNNQEWHLNKISHQKKGSVSLFQTPLKTQPHRPPTQKLNPPPPPPITTTQTCPLARFIMPFHADQNCSCMENNLEHISPGAVIYKLFLRP